MIGLRTVPVGVWVTRYAPAGTVALLPAMAACTSSDAVGGVVAEALVAAGRARRSPAGTAAPAATGAPGTVPGMAALAAATTGGPGVPCGSELRAAVAGGVPPARVPWPAGRGAAGVPAAAGSAPRPPGETVAAGAAWPLAGGTVLMDVAGATCPVVFAGPMSFVAFAVAPGASDKVPMGTDLLSQKCHYQMLSRPVLSSL